MSIKPNCNAILQNLKTDNLNGKICLVKEFVEKTENSGSRWKIVLPNGRTLLIRSENLKLFKEDTSDKKHGICMFWPESDLVVQSISGWPTNYRKEEQYLKEVFDFKNPQILGGITRKHMPKPDFMMYYDAANTTAKVNKWANQIAGLLPNFELGKVVGPTSKKGYRGACVLVYSPMFSKCITDDKSNTKTSSKDLKFSIDDIKKIIQFHGTTEATTMYEAHNNPMHRMFGSNMVIPNIKHLTFDGERWL